MIPTKMVCMVSNTSIINLNELFNLIPTSTHNRICHHIELIIEPKPCQVLLCHLHGLLFYILHVVHGVGGTVTQCTIGAVSHLKLKVFLEEEDLFYIKCTSQI